MIVFHHSTVCPVTTLAEPLSLGCLLWLRPATRSMSLPCGRDPEPFSGITLTSVTPELTSLIASWAYVLDYDFGPVNERLRSSESKASVQ